MGQNLLIFAPIILSHQYFSPEKWILSLFGFLSFSLMALLNLSFNDLLDLESDRKHHKKKERPLASGQLSIPNGVLFLFFLISMSVYLGSFLEPAFNLILVTYVFLNLAYSFKLKNIPVIDVIFLSAFYMIRLEAGSFASDIYLTQWLIMFALFIFISLGFLKRYCELLEQYNVSGKVNIDGRDYSTKDLPILLTSGNVAGQISVLCFLLYLYLGGAAKYYDYPKVLLLNGILFFYWISTLWFKASRGKVSGDPVRYSIKDPTSIVIGLLSVASIIIAKKLSFFLGMFN